MIDPVPASVFEDGVGDVYLTWETELGYYYEVARSPDLQDLGFADLNSLESTLEIDDLAGINFLPGGTYGYGQPGQVKIADAPPPPPAPGPPIPILPGYMFYLVGMPDGNAIIAWDSLGVNHRQFVNGFDLRQPDGSNILLGGVVHVGIDADLDSNNDYSIFAMVGSSASTLAAEPSLAALAAPAGEQATLSKISTQLTAMRAALLAPPGPGVQDPPAAHQFDDLGHPMREFYRVIRFKLDSDADGIWDDDEFAANGDPYDTDSDGNGIFDAYQNVDTDLDPTTYTPNSDPNNPQPIINEILIENDGVLEDGFGGCPGWIELYNPSTAPIVLDGWRLTDKAKLPGGPATVWKFVFPVPGAGMPPLLTMPPNSYLLVLASDKEVVDPSGYQHVNFVLGDSDEVGLGDPSGTLVDYHDLQKPQRRNISVGYAPDPEEAVELNGQMVPVGLAQPRYFTEPTPGGPNAPVSYLGISKPLAFTTPGGVFDLADLPGGFLPVSFFPSLGDTVFYTTNCAEPTNRSEIFGGSLDVSETTVVRATSSRRRFIPSKPVTRSYLFKHSVLGSAPQGTTPQDHQVRPDGYPDANATENTGTELIDSTIDYAMDPLVIQEERDAIAAGLSLPTISIAVPVQDFFNRDTFGLYANSRNTLDPSTVQALSGIPDPTGMNWERIGSFEYFDPAANVSISDNAIVKMNGASARMKQKTDKNSLRVIFKKDVSWLEKGKIDFGPNNQPFSTSLEDEFDTLLVRGTTHDAWTLQEAGGDYSRQRACYVRETFGRELHRRMGITTANLSGHLGASARWANLYLNGLYWGPYLLSERVDEKFAESTIDPDSSFDIITDGPPVSGNTVAWDHLLDLCDAIETATTGPSPDPVQAAALYAQLAREMDIDNYIDYMIVNLFMRNVDWAGHNYRAVRVAENEIVGAGASDWKYDDTGVDPGAGWAQPAFDDSGWQTGSAQLGYGDGDEATVIGFGGNANNKHITSRFRHTFEITGPQLVGFEEVRLSLLRDDGAIVYINGTEVHGAGLPAAPAIITATTLATSNVNGAAENAFEEVIVSPALLVAGNNVVAVQVHQQSVSSSDLSFDLALQAFGRFRFLMWDTEASMAQGGISEVKIHHSQSTINIPSLNAGPAQFHDRLFEYATYQQAFQARAALHFGAGGILGPVDVNQNPGGELWQEMADAFEPFAKAESARWGDAAEAETSSRRYGSESIPLTWRHNIAFNRETWIPQRRNYFLQKLAEFNLADPANHPDVTFP